MKAQIIKKLRDHSEGIPIAEIHSILKMPEQEFLEQIESLKDVGYTFSESSKNIKLLSSPDIPFSWEFPGREPNVHYFQEVKSTMINAREMAESGAPDFTVVIAERQGGGRGRLDRTWISSSGGLYFTIILRPNISPSLCYKVNFVASLVLARTLRNLYQIDAMVKWPNDILINEKKVSGMLSEMSLEGNKIDYCNLGIGINVNNDPTDKEPNATSLKLVLEKESSRIELLGSFLNEFEKKMVKIAKDTTVISEWKKYAITIGRNVKVKTTRDTFSGFAKDVDDQGALILEKPDGSQEAVIYGDCFLE